MFAADIQDGKASFQQADLMDLREGIVFWTDYTAEYLARLGTVTADNMSTACS